MKRLIALGASNLTRGLSTVVNADPPPSPRNGGPRPDSTGSLRLYAAAPDRRWLCGVEQRSRQPAIRTGGGTSVWLY